MRTRLPLAAATLIAALTLTACDATPDTSSTDDDSSYRTPVTDTIDTTTPDPAPSLDKHDLTRMSINITWDNSTAADQRNMCNGITMFGTDWAADQLRNGAGDDSLDWDYAAQIIQGKCGL